MEIDDSVTEPMKVQSKMKDAKVKERKNMCCAAAFLFYDEVFGPEIRRRMQWQSIGIFATNILPSVLLVILLLEDWETRILVILIRRNY